MSLALPLTIHNKQQSQEERRRCIITDNRGRHVSCLQKLVQVITTGARPLPIPERTHSEGHLPSPDPCPFFILLKTNTHLYTSNLLPSPISIHIKNICVPFLSLYLLIINKHFFSIGSPSCTQVHLFFSQRHSHLYMTFP